MGGVHTSSYNDLADMLLRASGPNGPQGPMGVGATYATGHVITTPEEAIQGMVENLTNYCSRHTDMSEDQVMDMIRESFQRILLEDVLNS